MIFHKGWSDTVFNIFNIAKWGCVYHKNYILFFRYPQFGAKGHFKLLDWSKNVFEKVDV